jgi:alkylation response protein AidB-like acyl-CoA dehydrogenase
MVARVLRHAENGEWPNRDLTLTKMRLGSVARRFATTVIQLHGGMGVSDELPASRLCKRLLMLDFEFGSAVDLESQLLNADKLAS